MRAHLESPRVAYLAAGWAFAFGALHLYWALGGEAGLRLSLALEGTAEDDLIADLAFRLQGLWGVVGLCWLAAAIALATVQPFRPQRPAAAGCYRLMPHGRWLG